MYSALLTQTLSLPAAAYASVTSTTHVAQSLTMVSSPSPFYTLEMIGKKGDVDAAGKVISAIEADVSINDNGAVAFVGGDKLGTTNFNGNALFVGDGKSASRDIAPAFHICTLAFFGSSAHINNVGQVAVKHSDAAISGGNGLIDNIRVFDSTQLN